MHMYMCIYMYIYIYSYTCKYKCKQHIYIYTYVYKCMFAHTYTYVCTLFLMYFCTRTYMNSVFAFEYLKSNSIVLCSCFSLLITFSTFFSTSPCHKPVTNLKIVLIFSFIYSYINFVSKLTINILT